MSEPQGATPESPETTPWPPPGAGAETTPTSPPFASDAPIQVEGFEIRRFLGAGGMGAVYEAEQSNPRRAVALKVLRAGVGDADAVRRFAAEVALLARLRHPGIATIHAAGTCEVGDERVPYFAMELVADGVPLSTYLRRNAPSRDERLRLFARVCEAVHHGHQKGVVHRDLKPGNILVDAGGQPKVIDFGVAAPLARGDGGVRRPHAPGQRPAGTVPYMSPEQLDEAGADNDVRSDVYALGIVLHEVLTGRHPLDLDGLSLTEVARRIRAGITAPPCPELARAGDQLQAVIGCAVARSPAERYASAHELALDVRRVLEHRPIAARPSSLARRFALFARRSPALLTGAALLCVALLAGAGGIIWGYFEAVEGERRARAATNRAVAESEAAQRARADAVAARDELEATTYTAEIAAAAGALAAGDGESARHHLEQAPADLRGWEWEHLASRLDTSEQRFYGHTRGVTDLAVDRDGRVLASASKDGSVRVWSAGGRTLSTLAGAVPVGGVLRFTPAGDAILAATRRGEIGVWEPETGRQLRVLGRPEGALVGVAIGGSAAPLLVVATPTRVRVWPSRGGAPLFDAHGLAERIAAVAISAAGDRLAVCGGGGTLWIWTLPGAELVQAAPREAVSGFSARLAFRPDGEELAVSTGGAEITVCDAASGAVRHVLRGHADAVTDLAYDAEGRWLASTSNDGTVRLWDAHSHAEVARFLGHRSATTCVVFCGRELLVSGSRDATLRSWSLSGEIPSETAPSTAGSHQRVSAARPGGGAPRGELRLVERMRVDAAGERWAQITSPRPGGPTRLVLGRGAVVTAEVPVPSRAVELAFSPDGETVVVGTASGRLECRAASDGRQLKGADGDVGAHAALHFTAAGDRLLTLGRSGGVQRWSWPDLEAQAPYSPPGCRRPSALAVHEESARMALGSADGRVFLIRGERARRLLGSTAPAADAGGEEVSSWAIGASAREAVRGIAFTDGGRHLVTLSGDTAASSLVLWDLSDVAEGRPAETFRSDLKITSAWSLAATPDGSRFLLSAADPSRLIVHDGGNGRELLSLRGELSLTYMVAGFSGVQGEQLTLHDPRGEWLRIDISRGREFARRLALRTRARFWVDGLERAWIATERVIPAILADPGESSATMREEALEMAIADGRDAHDLRRHLIARLLDDPAATPEERDEAVRTAEVLVELDPESREFARLLGIARFRAGRISEARQVFETLLEDGASDPTSVAYLALCDERRGRPADARRRVGDLRRMLRDEPQLRMELHSCCVREVEELLRRTSPPGRP